MFQASESAACVGGKTPPCAAAEERLCVAAKILGGTTSCKNCLQNNSAVLMKAGCHASDETKFCVSSTLSMLLRRGFSVVFLGVSPSALANSLQNRCKKHTMLFALFVRFRSSKFRPFSRMNAGDLRAARPQAARWQRRRCAQRLRGRASRHARRC